MKKIPLQINNFAESTRIIFRTFVQCDKPKMFGLIEFIVDTGSPITLISLKDRERLRISKIQIENIISKKHPITIGGGVVKAKIIPSVKLKLNGFETNMSVHIVDEGNHNSPHPSILGIDFLLKNKFKLIFDPTNNEAFFESVE